MSSTKTNSQMLITIKQYNKIARETRAIKEGFATSADLILYLQGEIKKGNGNATYKRPTGAKPSTVVPPAIPPTKKTSKVLPLIHVIDILDSSGSMAGEKIRAAIYGINRGVHELKADMTSVSYTYTLCDFSDDIIFRHVTKSLDTVHDFNGSTRGSTALFDAIGKTVDLVLPNIKSDDKVLVNIYTDGQENSSRTFNASQINALIKLHSERNWTFTFIGTPEDVRYAQSQLHIKESNTLTYDGTGAGLEKSFALNSKARSIYASKVSAGEDVSENFYKDLI